MSSSEQRLLVCSYCNTAAVNTGPCRACGRLATVNICGVSGPGAVNEGVTFIGQTQIFFLPK